MNQRGAQQSIATDGAVACFSSNLFLQLECRSRAAAEGHRYALCGMGDNLQNIISTLDGIKSVENEAELAKLDGAVKSLLASDHPELGIGALLRIFERFPDRDGYGVFWSLLHGLESLPGYERSLVESVRRQPSEFSLLMVNRILNAGKTQVDDTNLFVLLEEVARNHNYSEAIRKDAENFVEWQRGRA